MIRKNYSFFISINTLLEQHYYRQPAKFTTAAPCSCALRNQNQIIAWG